MTRRYLLTALFAVFISGCTGMSQREQSTLSGGAIGAGGGAILSGASGGRPAVGAALGGRCGSVDRVHPRGQGFAQAEAKVTPTEGLPAVQAKGGTP